MPRKFIIPIGPSIAYVPLTKDQLSLIDSADVPALCEMNWCAVWNSHTKSFYAKSSIGGCGVRLHRYLLSPPDGYTVDHKSGNTLDNRRSNLRLATHAQQAYNRKIRSDNKSGVKGVCLFNGKWRANIKVGGKTIDLGSHDSIDDAGKAYANAASHHFGDFVRT